jgi:hypothetical protein
MNQDWNMLVEMLTSDAPTEKKIALAEEYLIMLTKQTEQLVQYLERQREEC